MEDLNIKIKNPILAAQAIQAGKDSATASTTSLAQAFSQAFTQFLNKGAAKANHALPLSMISAATVPPASRQSYAPTPAERPLPVRADDPARFESAPPPAAKSGDDHPAPAQSSRRESANDNTSNAGNAPAASAPVSDDAAEDQAADRSAAAAAAKDTGAPKAAVAHHHAKGMTEKLVEGDHPGRKVARAAKTRFDDDRTPMETAQNVLAALAADPRPAADKNQEQNDSTETADDAAVDPRRADGIANALARLARNQARQENVRNGEDERTSEHDAEARGDDDKAAKTSAPATDARGRQAADLAQRVGPGERIAVEVNVADDAKTLVSRPAATLAAMTARGDGDKSASSQAANAASTHPEATANGLTVAAAPAAVAQTAASQAAVVKAGAVAEIGAATGAQNTAALSGQAQGTAAGPAATNAQSAAGTAAANAAQAAQRPAASFRAEILEQISVNIQKAVKDGTDKISIQLRPAELGRVDVRIEVTGDGRAHVHVTADRSDTLDLLQRDARDLARALQDAGLRADAGQMQFSLREQAADQRQARARSNGGVQGIDAAGAADLEAADVLPAWTPTAQPGRVDIRA